MQQYEGIKIGTYPDANGNTPTTGTVLSVSVNTANGFSGTVNNPTTTPAISIQTTVTGILKGNGTAVSAANVAIDTLPSQASHDGDILKSVSGAATWSPDGGGTVNTVSVATDNGFAGTVDTPTTTPVIHVETDVTGILLGDGTGVSAATATDIPTTNALTLVGNNLTSTVNSVDSNTVDLSTITPPTTNNIHNNGVNGMISTVNGVASTGTIILSLGISKFLNAFSFSANGFASAPSNVVDTNTISLSGSALKTSVNGVDSNTVDVQPRITSPTNDNLIAMDGSGVNKDAGVQVTTLSTSNDNTHIMTSAAVQAAIVGSPSGSVTNVSVVSLNGFAGTVANPATTPAITMKTTITGVLKGDGTAILAASGSDIITSNALSLAGTSLKSTVDGVDSNTVSVQPLITTPTANDIVTTNGSGQVIDSGVSITTSTASNDNTHVMTSAAVQTNLATKEPTITVLAATKGGTGFSSYAVGDLLFANTTTTLAKRAAVALGQVIISNGVSTMPIYSANPLLSSVTVSANFLINSGAFQAKIESALLTANCKFSIPNADSNPVQPSAGSTNQFAIGINSSGVISYAQPSISTDVQKSSFVNPVTTVTEVVVAIAPLQNANGFYILNISDSSQRQLTICFKLIAGKNYLGYPPSSTTPFASPSIIIDDVNDTQNTITAANISQYFTFSGRLRTASPNPYVAVTVRMSGGLLYGSGAYTYTCTSFAESFLSDNTAITQFISQNYTALDAVATSTPYLINVSYIPPTTTYGALLYLFCLNFGANNINMYTINTLTGLPTNNSPSTISIGSSPRNIIISRDGKYAYATNSVSTNIQMMLLNMATGILTNNSTPTIGAGTNVSYIAIVPAYQNFLYVTNRGDATIGGYLIDRSTGLLSPLSPATTPVGAVGGNPIGIAITNTLSPNVYLYVANNVNATISMFQITLASGALTPLVPATIARSGAYFNLIHPNGLFFYSSSDSLNNIIVYSIAPTTGLLTLVQTAAAGTTTREMAITPNGAFLYALNNGANTIQEFSVSLITGQLSSLGTVALTNPTSIKMSPNGLYIYVSSGTSNNVTVYRIDPSTGLLTVAGLISAGTNAFSVTIA